MVSKSRKGLDAESSNHSSSRLFQLDDNPIQIADVQTEVEREGEKARSGNSIDISSFMYQSSNSVVSDLDALLGSVFEEEKIKKPTIKHEHINR